MMSNITITFRLDKLECAKCSMCLSVFFMSIFFISVLLSIVVPDIFISLVGDEAQHHFLENLVLYISKGYRSLSTCENVWL